MGAGLRWVKKRGFLNSEELAARHRYITQQRTKYGFVFEGLVSWLSHLKPRLEERTAWHFKFHQSRDGSACLCAQCRSDMRPKVLPDITEPDTFLWDEKNMLDQRQSSLFSVLPAEVRMMIWEEMFAGFVVTLEPGRGNYGWSGGWIFQPDEIERWWRREPCEELHLRADWRKFCGQHAALHRTCRLIYSETKQILCERNLFYIPRLYDLSRLQFHFRPNWLSLIRRVYCEGQNWEHLPRLPALRELVLVDAQYSWDASTWRDSSHMLSGRECELKLPDYSMAPLDRYQLVTWQQLSNDKRQEFLERGCEVVEIPDAKAYSVKLGYITPRNPFKQYHDWKYELEAIPR